jgi:hypothetical protein
MIMNYQCLVTFLKKIVIYSYNLDILIFDLMSIDCH